MLANSFGVLLLAACSNAMLTKVEKEEIVSVHNALRGEVHPAAANMQKMLWDEQLSIAAQEHSKLCVWAPNQKANAQSVASFPEGVGENLAFSFSSASTNGVKPVRFVHEWFAESAFYNLSSNECVPKETCKHYKQVVWSNSHAIGCGIHTCESFDFFGVTLPNATFFSCLYGTVGNTVGVKPYTEGAECSQCPTHASTCEVNLCVVALGSNTTGAGVVDLVGGPNAAAGAAGAAATATAGPSGPTVVPANTEAQFNGSAAIPGGNISAPPLVAMPPPSGVEVITEAPTTVEPATVPSLLPSHCGAPETSTQREGCWRSAWLLWTKKYNQWAAGECAQPAGTTAAPATQLFPGLI